MQSSFAAAYELSSSLLPSRDGGVSPALGCPSRAATGTGSWDIDKHLEWEPELQVPFQDPAVLRSIPNLPFPLAASDPPEASLALFDLWRSKGLLHFFTGPFDDRQICRTFGAYKSESADRMRGDRRGPNSLEGRVYGPCRSLPPGQQLINLCLPRWTHVLIGASTDRADFFHPIGVSIQRAKSNIVGPGFHRAQLLRAGFKDLLPNPRPRSILAPGPGDLIYGGFGALFQGDHWNLELLVTSTC